MNTAEPVLRVSALSVQAQTAALGTVMPVTDVSFDLHPGEIVGLIGESGCGKTTIAKSLVGLLAKNATISRGSISIEGQVVLSREANRMDEVRGDRIGIVFQNAMSSLNPLMRVQSQLDETLKRHRTGLSRQDRRQRIETSLRRMGFTDVDRILRSYPHQLSGGMRQRVAIALATVLEPRIVVADECTTALDVTTQSEVVELLRDLAHRLDAALLFVTHDLLLAAEICTRIMVMYSGQIVESGPVETVLTRPLHPYTRALLSAVPSLSSKDRLVGIPGMPALVRPGDQGCRFADRCALGEESCRVGEVPWFESDSEERHGHRCRVTAADSIK